MFDDPYFSLLIIVALVSLLMGVIIGVSLTRPTSSRY